MEPFWVTAPWFRLKKYIIKKSSRLSLLNDFSSLKSKEFNLKDIEVDVDSEEQHWFKRAHVGEYLGLVYIHRSTAKLGDEDQKSRAFLQAEGGCRSLTALGKMLKVMIFPSHLLVFFMSL